MARVKSVKLTSLQSGDMVEVDDGFTCLEPWTTHQVRKNFYTEQLYIDCASGLHYLSGQVDEDGYLVGIIALEKFKK